MHLSGQTNVAVPRMSTDDASRLKNSCSRPCLVGISVRDASVVVLRCLGGVSGRHGDVSVLYL